MTEERCAKGRESPEPPPGRTRPGLSTAAGRQDLRTRIVRRGFGALCLFSTTISTSGAANIPLFSAIRVLCALNLKCSGALRLQLSRQMPCGLAWVTFAVE
jgi:hypothetical protein